MTTLLENVQIEGFRSFRRARVADLEDYVPIIGLNGSGKSNVLRALNLFFNGVLDEERTPPRLSRDHPDFLAGVKRKKSIRVQVEFDLSGGYGVRNTQEFLEAHGISERVVIERTWSLGPNKLDLLDTFRFGDSRGSLEDAREQDRQSLLSLIQSVEFRYVPNHLRPADLIRDEIQALRPKLINRLRKTKAFREGGVDETMTALAGVASGMFGPLAERVAPGTSGRAVVPDIPTDFAELVFQLGLNTMTESGSVQPTEVQGSGTQSFILLHVLHLLDKAMREQGFGWKQYTVWGIEEPESFLHARLRTRFAEDLRQFAGERRRQIFTTTHQDEFVRVADHAWLTALDNGETTIEKLPAREALSRSSRLRISTFTHPLMSAADHPLVLVEGKSDAEFLRAAAQRSPRRPRWKLISMDDIDPTQAGGDNIRTFLQANRAVVASRPLEAPVIVLRDWEDTKYKNTDKLLREYHEASRAWRCPPDLCNQQLGNEFRGIERYLTTDYIESVIPGDDLIPQSKNKPYPLRIDGGVLHRNKAGLLQGIVSGEAEPGPHLLALFEWIDDEVQRVLGALPPTLFT